MNSIKLALYFCLSLFPLNSFSQFGNEWINYDQTYYSFKIHEDGVYRIGYLAMLGSGIPVQSISSDEFKVYAKEQQQAIYIKGGEDGSFDPGDYIEFYGTKNNSWLDEQLFEDKKHIPNPNYSLYNDTLIYYLTWGNIEAQNKMAFDNDLNFNSYQSKDYVWKESFYAVPSFYGEGPLESGVSSSWFQEGEGWYSFQMSKGSTVQQNIETPKIYKDSDSPLTKFKAVIAGRSNPAPSPINHHMQLFVNDEANGVSMDTVYSGYQLNHLNWQTETSTLSETNQLIFKIVDDLALGNLPDFQNVCNYQATYPREIDISGENYFNFSIPSNGGSKNLLKLTGVNSGALLYSISEDTRRINFNYDNGIITAIVPQSSTDENTKCLLIYESEITKLTQLTPVRNTGKFKPFYSLLTQDSLYFILSEQSLLNDAQKYADYRSSTAGGNHNVLVVDIDELYHQFGGGVVKHALSIRRFIDFALQTAPSKPQHLLLLGKSVRDADENILFPERGSRNDATSYQNNLVPSYGYPPSDILLTAGLDGSKSLEPAVPTGRISARNGAQVLEYLNKIKEYELQQSNFYEYNVDNKNWMKKVLHFGGGSSAFEQTSFRGYLENYATIIADSSFGGEIRSFFKTTSDPINPVSSQDLKEEINSGVSMMTFFGHAGGEGFDQSIDNPKNWENKGKYPFVLGNACFTGDIHKPLATSISEQFVLQNEKGAIGFLSSVKLGFAAELNRYSTELYNNISITNYGKSLGASIKNTIAEIQGNSPSLALQNVSLGMTLHGDPALKINSHLKPEFFIDESSVRFTPSEVSLDTDSIDIEIEIINLGRATNQLFLLEVKRFYPNNQGDTTYSFQIDGISHKKTISFKFPVSLKIAKGVNRFDISVDIPSKIEEQDDEINNNRISVNYVIGLDGVTPIYPYNKSIIGEFSELIASTTNPLASNKGYLFEIDTTDSFDSPWKKSQEVFSLGGNLRTMNSNWSNSSLILADSMVYFWRVALSEEQPYLWSEQSFQYIPSKTGWGEDHFFQLKTDNFNTLIYNKENRSLEFGNNYKTLGADSYGDPQILDEYVGTQFRLDNVPIGTNLCTDKPALHLVVVDPLTLEPWRTHHPIFNPDGKQLFNTNHYNACRKQSEMYFIYHYNEFGLNGLAKVLKDSIPDGHYLLLYTAKHAEFNNFTPDLSSALTTLGMTGFDSTSDPVPFVFFTQKGNTEESSIKYGLDQESFVTHTDTVWGSDYIGSVTSTIIGPSTNWESLYWKQSPTDDATGDTSRIRLYGLSPNDASIGVELIDVEFSSEDSLINLSQYIDADQYPYVRLTALLQDDINFTPMQLDHWIITYAEVPEFSINPQIHFEFNALNSKLEEGQTVELEIAFENLSPIDGDSLLVKHWIEDQNNKFVPIIEKKVAPLLANSYLTDQISFSTIGIPGENRLWIEINPKEEGKNTYNQLEKLHENNLFQVLFFVEIDQSPPLLDITFDGRTILNEDIVSARPEILISLSDDNPFLELDEESDTSYFQIWLTHPDGTLSPIYFNHQGSDYQINWDPVGSISKQFSIEFLPYLDIDGTYQLIVQGADKSGNSSSQLGYKVEFQVINKSTISQVLNYPNPFSTKTHFVFTLTGGVLPTDMKIEIMTISGKIVREIFMNELGTIRVGRNITDFYWDGTDNFGNQLANGVYLYRVTAKIEDWNYEKMGTNADQYFKHGIGKMTLIR